MKFNSKYRPLFDQEFREKNKIRYIPVIGGRASGKSTAIAHAIHDISFNPYYVILNTRFAATTAKDSIIAEMEKAIEKRDSVDFFRKTNNNIINEASNSKIIFKGLQTARLTQTAALKSITDLNIWVLDEAEELFDSELFDDIDETIRRKNVENLIILVTNTYRLTPQHFIYKRFFAERGVNWGFNGIVDDVCYIFTTYLDNIANLSESSLRKIEYYKKTNPESFNRRFLGEIGQANDLLFSENSLHFYEGELNDNFSNSVCYVDTADKGKDYFCAVFGKVYGEKIYIDDVIMNRLPMFENEKLLIEKIQKNKTDFTVIETNYGGSYFVQKIYEATQRNIKPVFNNQHKETRILAMAGYIIDNFVFRKDVKLGLEYFTYMEQLKSYSTEGTNEHDDAPDATAGLAKFCNNYLKI